MSEDNRCGMYVLDASGEPRHEPDGLVWGSWYETADRQVAETTLFRDLEGKVRVSTVFLGLDHAFGQGPPILWETMVFSERGGCKNGDYERRYASREAALAGHEEVVRRWSEPEGPTDG